MLHRTFILTGLLTMSLASVTGYASDLSDETQSNQIRPKTMAAQVETMGYRFDEPDFDRVQPFTPREKVLEDQARSN